MLVVFWPFLEMFSSCILPISVFVFCNLSLRLCILFIYVFLVYSNVF